MASFGMQMHTFGRFDGLSKDVSAAFKHKFHDVVDVRPVASERSHNSRETKSDIAASRISSKGFLHKSIPLAVRLRL